MSGLEPDELRPDGIRPDELRRLLFEAVEPIRSSSEAYNRIRGGVIRRRRMRVPAMTFGGLALAGLIGFAYVAIDPRPSSNLVEPARPPLTQSVTDTTAVRASSQPAGHGGSTGSGGVRPSATPGRSEPAVTATDASPGPASTATATRPSTTPSNVNSPTLPPPVSFPAKPGDIDGDGVIDSPSLSGSTIVVALSRLGTVSVTLPAVVSPLTASVVDIDANGYGELIVQTDSSGDTRNFGVIRLAPNGQLQVVSGSPLHAGLNGTHGDGFRCESGTFVAVAGDNTVDRIYSVTSTTWQLTKVGFTKVGSPTSSTVDLASAPSPFTAGCGIA